MTALREYLRSHYWARLTATLPAVAAAHYALVLFLNDDPSPFRWGNGCFLLIAASVVADPGLQHRRAVTAAALFAGSACLVATVENSRHMWSTALGTAILAGALITRRAALARTWQPPPEPAARITVGGRVIPAVLRPCPQCGWRHWIAYSPDVPRVLPTGVELTVSTNLAPNHLMRCTLAKEKDHVGRIWLSVEPDVSAGPRA